MPLKPEQVTELNAAQARVTAGTAQGATGGNAGDVANLAYATKNYGYKAPAAAPAGGNLPVVPTTAAPATNVALANAVEGKTPFEAGTGIQGYDAAMAKENQAPAATQPNSTDWMTDWMKNAFGTQSKDNTITAPTFAVEKTRLEEARNSRLAALDATYATDLARTQKQNKDVGNSLKARLIKLGVKPSDSAWSNAEAGQLDRDRAVEDKLRSEYMSNKAKIESDSDTALTNIAMNEATMAFNANVKNIETKLQTQAQGINLFEIFSSRDQSEKDREQRAYASALDYQGKMATLDQAQQEAISKNFIENAQAGLYNVSDKATLEMLSKLEKESPYLTGLVGIASSGLSDRLDKKALDAANLQKIKADTAQSYASINKMKSEAGSNKELTKFYDDASSQLALLSSGKTDWNTAYSTLKTKYPVADASQGQEQDKLIDTLLNKAVWSQPGAYETIAGGRKATVDPTTQALIDKLGSTQ